MRAFVTSIDRHIFIAFSKVRSSSSNIRCRAVSSLVPNKILFRNSLSLNAPKSQLFAIKRNAVNHLSNNSPTAC